MKKTVLFGLLAIMLAFSGCDKGSSNSTLFAQSNNDAQRIVGTWKTEGEEVIFTFNANGTFTFSGANVFHLSANNTDRREGNYMVANSKLILRTTGARASNSPRDFYLSTDGKILVFEYSYYKDDEDRYSRSHRQGNLWLIKQ